MKDLIDASQVGARLDESRGEQPFDLGGKQQPVSFRRGLARPEQRTDAEAVACQDESATTLVPDGEGELTPQMLEQLVLVFFPEMRDQLRVAVGGEAMPSRFQSRLELGIVEQLAVEDDDDAAVLVGDRLAAVRQADDAEAAIGETEPVGLEVSVVVGAAVNHGVRHATQAAERNGPVATEIDDTGDATHRIGVSGRRRFRRSGLVLSRRASGAARHYHGRLAAWWTGVTLRPASVVFTAGPWGKPMLDATIHGTALRFNLSHSHELALVVVARDRDVGVDVERMRVLPDLEGIVARFFSAAERATLDRLPRDRRLHAFFRFWTVKEAYLKACGDGLNRGLDHLDVELGADQQRASIRALDRPDDERRWELFSLTPRAGYVAAVAVDASVRARTAHRSPRHRA